MGWLECVRLYNPHTRPSFEYPIGILQVPYKFVDLVYGDVMGFCHVNHGTEVRIEDNRHNKLLSIARVSGKPHVSTELFITLPKIGLLWWGRRRTDWDHSQGQVLEIIAGDWCF
jgi:hypothetical protein